jgi:hypothetical protein
MAAEGTDLAMADRRRRRRFDVAGARTSACERDEDERVCVNLAEPNGQGPADHVWSDWWAREHNFNFMNMIKLVKMIQNHRKFRKIKVKICVSRIFFVDSKSFDLRSTCYEVSLHGVPSF